ncbi:MAG: DUF2798 domain-containing protein [Novosphingobium sp.]
MGFVTTGVVTLSLLVINVGFTDKLLGQWLRSWGVAYIIIIPLLVLVGPNLQSKINRLID